MEGNNSLDVSSTYTIPRTLDAGKSATLFSADQWGSWLKSQDRLGLGEDEVKRVSTLLGILSSGVRDTYESERTSTEESISIPSIRIIENADDPISIAFHPAFGSIDISLEYLREVVRNGNLEAQEINESAFSARFLENNTFPGGYSDLFYLAGIKESYLSIYHARYKEGQQFIDADFREHSKYFESDDKPYQFQALLAQMRAIKQKYRESSQNNEVMHVLNYLEGRKESALRARYGERIASFAHEWTDKSQAHITQNENFEVRKLTYNDFSEPKTVYSIIDSQGERVGSIEGYLYQIEGGEDTYFDSRLAADVTAKWGLIASGSVDKHNAFPPRDVRRIVAHAIVELVVQNDLTWFSSDNLSKKGAKRMYGRYIKDEFDRKQKRVRVSRARITPGGRGTKYKITARKDTEAKRFSFAFWNK